MRTLLWLGLGAAAMYLLDPDQGRRRRARVQDKMAQARRAIRERAERLPRENKTPESAQHPGR